MSRITENEGIINCKKAVWFDVFLSLNEPAIKVYLCNLLAILYIKP